MLSASVTTWSAKFLASCSKSRIFPKPELCLIVMHGATKSLKALQILCAASLEVLLELDASARDVFDLESVFLSLGGCNRGLGLTAFISLDPFTSHKILAIDKPA